jgi:hypothetical protein
MTRPSAKNRELNQGHAASEAEEQNHGEARETAAGDAPANPPEFQQFPAATQTDEGKPPLPVKADAAPEVREKTPNELIADARIEKLLNDAEVAEAQRQVELAELRAEMDEMRRLLGRVQPAGPATIQLRSKSVNQEVFARNWLQRAGNAGKAMEDAPVLGKTFKVVPQGQSLKMGMPIAVVTNAADAADAKATYALSLGKDGGSITADVQLVPDSTAAQR